ncbi:acetyl-CoA C-acyltransferase [Lentilitoribacter sp. Alg239-R112]|uniref:thiolase family protein n=1 Tax=Lentilitoribacter sp. Alg239-R112 TaxID=2305987 RepID=UPI0013A6D0C3|nr:acetyl-CoA C-acyltransferase [Lentilitoribacter sp. Alg239-R112]
MKKDSIVIVGASRTPIGAMMGGFAPLSASQLGGAAVKATLKNANVTTDQVDEILMGNVLSAGQGQAPARQTGFHAGLGKSIPATTINKMCGSGLKTITMAHDQLLADNGKVLVAGGMESMTNAPHLLPAMRAGVRLGQSVAVDHMMKDGLEDAYETGRAMGTFAEDCVDKFKFTREQQDAYSLESLARAKRAQSDGSFAKEIIPVTVSTRTGDMIVTQDEQPDNARPEKIPHLRPVFKKDGTVTAANSSSISDGAAAVVLMRESDAIARNANIRARIVAHASHAQEPNWFTTAPVPAMQKALKKSGWAAEDVDLWEINEAFAVVPMAAMHELNLDHSIVNVNGGACALGHPIGASGARILVTLINALEARNMRKGMASLCIGGGEGIALTIERLN